VRDESHIGLGRLEGRGMLVDLKGTVASARD
jgi:hypothetical protein